MTHLRENDHWTTRAVRRGLESDRQHGAVIPPLYLSSNYTFRTPTERRQFDYTRSGNPTRSVLADALADLEGAVGATVTASGMAAIAAVLHLVEPGGLIVAAHDCYGGTWRLLDAFARRGACEVRFVDFTDEVQWTAALKERPALVWVETPSNPLLRVTDLAAVLGAARSAGALTAVDNTFLSPALQTPIEWGADLVVHSTTKYLNGHSDVVGGAVCAATKELHEQVEWWVNCLGMSGAPFDAYQTLRGLRTLPVRMRAHEENARAVAELLDRHPAVAQVYYPGLASDPGHELAARQQRGFGGMLSFELAAGGDAVASFIASLQCFSLAESLGGVESLVAVPSTMTHAAMSAEARQAAGIADGLIRLSVGIEDADDLCSDLARGLDVISRPSSTPREAEVV